MRSVLFSLLIPSDTIALIEFSVISSLFLPSPLIYVTLAVASSSPIWLRKRVSYHYKSILVNVGKKDKTIASKSPR